MKKRRKEGEMEGGERKRRKEGRMESRLEGRGKKKEKIWYYRPQSIWAFMQAERAAH